jgi:tetratricopeptide (TPR) repeat protein
MLSIRTIGAVCAMSWLSATTALAVDAGDRVVESVQPWAFKRIERAHQDLRAEQFDYVLETLDEMKANHKLNSHEQALMWQTYGYAYIGLEDYDRAADALGRCLETRGLPFQAELHTRYNLAQILVMLERHERAIAEFEEWFRHADNPSPTAHYMAAMAYMQGGQRRRAIEFVDRAIAGSATPKESWLQLKNAMLVEEKDFAGAEAVLTELIARYPKKAYWMQLAAIYSETKRHERALTTLEMVYLQGLFDQDSEYITLAQMYLFNQIPYQAAAVINDGLDKGVIEDSAQAWQLLADSWMHARERDRALPPMRRAAELAEDGNLYVRLAQILVDREEWGDAREAIAMAQEKGGLRYPGHAQLLLGIASANEERWGEAEQAFAAARQDEKTEKAAEYWLRHLAERHAQSPNEQASAVGVANPAG